MCYYLCPYRVTLSSDPLVKVVLWSVSLASCIVGLIAPRESPPSLSGHRALVRMMMVAGMECVLATPTRNIGDRLSVFACLVVRGDGAVQTNW